MARPKKAVVDYFPHFVNHGKTMFTIENKFGNDGYAFWFKLLELLGSAEQHYLDCNDYEAWEYLLAKTKISEEVAIEILELLVKLNAIDKELWNNKIIRSDNFIDNLSTVYKRRDVELLKNEEILSLCIHKPPLNDVIVDINPQSKVKESKVKKSKEEDKSSLSACTDSVIPLSPKHYQEILEYWNTNSKLKEITIMSEARKGAINARVKEHDLSAIYKAIDNVSNSSFMRGDNSRGWMATFDWVFRPKNFLKVLEGNYLDKTNNSFSKPKQVKPVPDWYKDYEKQLVGQAVEKQEITEEEKEELANLVKGIMS